MSDHLPTVTHTGEQELLGFRLTVHTLSDGTRIYANTPEFRGLMKTLGLTICDDGSMILGADQPIECEVVK